MLIDSPAHPPKINQHSHPILKNGVVFFAIFLQKVVVCLGLQHSNNTTASIFRFVSKESLNSFLIRKHHASVQESQSLKRILKTLKQI